MKAGANFAGATPGTLTADLVNQNNAAVAQAFGLSDLTGTTFITTVATNGGANAAYILGDGLTNAEKYGAVLAALSGMDSNGSQQGTINTLAANLTVTGAAAVDNTTTGSLVSDISNILATTSASVSIATSPRTTPSMARKRAAVSPARTWRVPLWP
ncbi:MAG: hypothetical protein PHD37_03790 [Gallionellaceae bacterium]|nr:hypothetical protein [Gallionellaceae bacterium]